MLCDCHLAIQVWRFLRLDTNVAFYSGDLQHWLTDNIKSTRGMLFTATCWVIWKTSMHSFSELILGAYGALLIKFKTFTWTSLRCGITLLNTFVSLVGKLQLFQPLNWILMAIPLRTRGKLDFEVFFVIIWATEYWVF